MSSGFVSGGTADAPIKRDAAWLAAEQELEAARSRKAAETQQSGGRSLFETLEANKAAKQDAFEEAARLKNQFRALDADEVDFLDSVLEKARTEEEQIRFETNQGLETFRRAQAEADSKAVKSETEQVLDSKSLISQDGLFKKVKRKRGGEGTSRKGLKFRKPESNSSPLKSVQSAGGDVANAVQVASDGCVRPSETNPSEVRAPEIKPSKAETTGSKGKLSLVLYSSDSDEE